MSLQSLPFLSRILAAFCSPFSSVLAAFSAASTVQLPVVAVVAVVLTLQSSSAIMIVSAGFVAPTRLLCLRTGALLHTGAEPLNNQFFSHGPNHAFTTTAEM